MFGIFIGKLNLVALINRYQYFFSVTILLGTIRANPIYETTENQVNKLEISTISTQIYEPTTADQLLENQTTSQLNVTSLPTMATAESLIPNATARNLAIQGKVVTSNTTYNYYSYTSSNNSSSGLSGGATAGIIIGVLALLCCCCILGLCGKSGHWETRKVWVEN